MNLWELVTGNSTLPVQSGITFWDHMQNQKSGGVGSITINHLENFSVEIIQEPISAILKESPILVTLNESIIEAELIQDS